MSSMPVNNLKETLYEFCQIFIRDRILRIQFQIKEIQEALSSETKSSAGDKHETGRAMLQLEREKLGQQLLEAEKTKQILASVAIENTSPNAGLGSLIFTSKGTYFLAISSGAFNKEGADIFCISIQTPIGKLLLGKSAGDSISFNNERITISEIR